nr:PREDICTED: SUN domain-containing protein 2-like [Bemisia tabaci]
MEPVRNSRSRSSMTKKTVNLSVTNSAKSIKIADESTLSKFSWTSDRFDHKITSNGTETPKPHPSPTRKTKATNLESNNPVLDAQEYKEIVSKLKRASSKEILDYYNKFGSMWFNEFPKTDYVYSPTSENYGKEVAPGIPLKPNMSRSPIRSHNLEYLPRSRLDTSDKSYEATARCLFPLDAESQVNYLNELREKSSYSHSSYSQNRSLRRSNLSRNWFQVFFSIFTFAYSCTLGRIFFSSKNSVAPTWTSPNTSHLYPDPAISRRWYYGFTRFLYRSLFFFQRLDVVLISAARSSVQQVFRPIFSSFGHHLKPLAVFTLCLPLILLFLFYWWPELYSSCGSYLENFLSSSPLQILSKSVTSASDLLSSWTGDLNIFLLLRPFASILEFFVGGVSSAATLILSTVSYIIYLVQTSVFTVFSYVTVPFVFATSKLSEGLASVVVTSRPPPAHYQSRGQSPDIDYKILAENILKSSEMQKTLNDWLSEQSHLLEKNQKYKSADPDVITESFKQFLSEELDDRENKNKESLQQSIQQKNVELREELNKLEQELKDREAAENVARSAVYDDLQQKINEIQNQLKWQALRFRRCCSRREPPISARTVEKHVVNYLSKLLSTSEPLSQNDIRSHLDAIYVARDKLENKLSNLTYHLDHRIREASEASMDVIMAAVTERMSDELSKRVNNIVSVQGATDSLHSNSFDTNSLQQYINRTIEHVLSLYDADKTGMADFALESSGGTVLNIKCTESSTSTPAVWYFYGIPVWWTSNNPRKAIQPGMQPGECWSFVGSTGYLVIQLSATIKIHTFSVEHIPKSLSRNGSIDSAPKDFSVWGLKDEQDKETYFLGKFRYEENGTSLQYFSAKPQDRPFNIVELRIESNWGNLEYTCLYRFRVHGVPV